MEFETRILPYEYEGESYAIEVKLRKLRSGGLGISEAEIERVKALLETLHTERALLRTWRTFQKLHSEGKLPEFARLELHADLSGSILASEVVARNVEWDGRFTCILERKHEIAVCCDGSVFTEQEPYPYQEFVRWRGWKHPEREKT